MIYNEPAYAKLNLTLDILGRRPDGYHDLRMVMQSVGLADEVRVEVGAAPGLAVTSDLPFLPRGEGNLAGKAVAAFFRETNLPQPGLAVEIKKHVPVCAGMAGGSSDGAAVLRVLRRACAPDLPLEKLEKTGALVGSDVPYCIRGGTALAEGRGEVLTDLAPLPLCHIVVCKPSYSISTPELFAQVHVQRLRFHPKTEEMCAALERGDLEEVAMRLYNVFEEVLPRRYAQVFEIKNRLLDLGAMAASMTGSGPSVFGIFRDAGPAQAAAEALSQSFPATFLCQPVGKAV